MRQTGRLRRFHGKWEPRRIQRGRIRSLAATRIDPAIILYSTYLAGEEKDRVHDIAADADGDAYAVGWTDSELFPTKNAYQPGENFDTEEASSRNLIRMARS